MISIKAGWQEDAVDKALRRTSASNLSGENKKKLMRVLVQGANRMRNEILKGMARTPHHGFPYKRGNKTHIASRGGEMPAVDTGQLLRSIMYDVSFGDMSVEIGAEAGAPYAAYLEFGHKQTITRSGSTGFRTLTSFVGPRPFLTPAMEHNRQWIEDMLVRTLTQIITGGKDVSL